MSALAIQCRDIRPSMFFHDMQQFDEKERYQATPEAKQQHFEETPFGHAREMEIGRGDR